MAKVTHIDDALARVLERLDALEEENSAVTAENERLAAKVAALENSTAPPAGPPADGAQPGDHADPVVSRRGLLKRLVGAGAAGTGLLVVRDTFAPRAAFATTGPMQFGTTNDAGHDQTTLTAAPGNVATMNVANTVPFGSGLYGSGHAPSGITPPLAGGVIGDSDTLAGVCGASSTAQGVRGIGKATSGLVGLVETQSEFGTPLCGVLAETGGFENNNSALVALNGGGR